MEHLGLKQSDLLACILESFGDLEDLSTDLERVQLPKKMQVLGPRYNEALCHHLWVLGPSGLLLLAAAGSRTHLWQLCQLGPSKNQGP